MPDDFGSLPRGGYLPVVCELLVDDIESSLSFWRDLLGFEIAYKRPEQSFAYLQNRAGAQIMLCQRSGEWETGAMDRPFGRGVMFQFQVGNIDELCDRLARENVAVRSGPRDVWRRCGEVEYGRREIVTSDPDGYLVMLAEPIGFRPPLAANPLS